MRPVRFASKSGESFFTVHTRELTLDDPPPSPPIPRFFSLFFFRARVARGTVRAKKKKERKIARMKEEKKKGEPVIDIIRLS